MIFSNLMDHPKETVLSTSILGFLLSDGLTAIELAILARLIFDVGDVVATFAILATARETAANAKTDQNVPKPAEIDISARATADTGNTQTIIKELQQQNKSLQEQIWELQKLVANATIPRDEPLDVK